VERGLQTAPRCAVDRTPTDFEWLAEIENDIALVIEPRSKADRLVLTERRLVEAGLTLIREAEMFGKTAQARAIQRIAHRPPGPASHSDKEGGWK
jgi:hypothetical protein